VEAACVARPAEREAQCARACARIEQSLRTPVREPSGRPPLCLGPSWPAQLLLRGGFASLALLCGFDSYRG